MTETSYNPIYLCPVKNSIGFYFVSGSCRLCHFSDKVLNNSSERSEDELLSIAKNL